jgi:hypothetical protein
MEKITGLAAFQNLSVKELNFHREPVLWVGFTIAILTVVEQVLGGSLGLEDSITALVQVVLAFFLRGRVTNV